MKLIFDLDGTLIESTDLNNDAYNFALAKYGLKRIIAHDRIIRRNLSFITPPTLSKIIESKQTYFVQDWLPYRIFLNHELLAVVRKAGKENCILWTRAEKSRTEAILDRCRLRKYFCQIVYDNKNSYAASMTRLREIINSDELFIFEDNGSFFESTLARKIFTVKCRRFCFSAYFIA